MWSSVFRVPCLLFVLGQGFPHRLVISDLGGVSHGTVAPLRIYFQ